MFTNEDKSTNDTLRQKNKSTKEYALDAMRNPLHAGMSIREVVSLTGLNHKALVVAQQALGIVSRRQERDNETREAVTNPAWADLSDRELSALTGIPEKRIARQRGSLRKTNGAAR